MRGRAQRRAGYTLVELLLALAVLAMLAGLTVPSALRLQADSQLSSAGELVRLQLAGSRMRAIESGLVYQFRYEPGGAYYVSLPYEREFENSNLNATGTGGTVGVGKYTRFAGKLPDGMTFAASSQASESKGVELSAEEFGELPNADDLAGVRWSAPILFVPDGAALNRAVTVTDRRGERLQLKVRGLTGATSVARLPGESAP